MAGCHHVTEAVSELVNLASGRLPSCDWSSEWTCAEKLRSWSTTRGKFPISTASLESVGCRYAMCFWQTGDSDVSVPYTQKPVTLEKLEEEATDSSIWLKQTKTQMKRMQRPSTIQCKLWCCLTGVLYVTLTSSLMMMMMVCSLDSIRVAKTPQMWHIWNRQYKSHYATDISPSTTYHRQCDGSRHHEWDF